MVIEIVEVSNLISFKYKKGNKAHASEYEWNKRNTIVLCLIYRQVQIHCAANSAVLGHCALERRKATRRYATPHTRLILSSDRVLVAARRSSSRRRRRRCRHCCCCCRCCWWPSHRLPVSVLFRVCAA